MSLGVKAVIEVVVEKFGASLDEKTSNELSVMHIAAQSYTGFLSILILGKIYKFDVNIQDQFKASPLHFAVINREPKNVEMLLKFGATPNVKDYQGQTPLHIAVIRMS